MSDYAPTFKDPRTAFEQALAAGALSPDPSAERYAGDFMYMHTWDKIDYFKHILTENRQGSP